MTNPEPLHSPSLLRRFAAMFYDAWLVLALMLACSALMIVIKGLVTGTFSLPPGERFITGWWKIPNFLLSLFALCHFYVYFWIKNGQTLGMQTWRIRVDNANHEHINLKQAYIRLAMAAVSMVCGGLGYLWMYIDKDKLTWHDRVSGTHLVLLPKNKK